MKRLSVFIVILLLFPLNAFPLTLEEGLKIVTERGRDVRISEAEEEVVSEGVSLARAALFPGVDVYANQSWLRYQPEAAFGPLGAVPLSEKDFFTYGFRVDQLVYDFGKTYSTIRAARFGLRAKNLDTVRVRNLVALDFALAYLDLLETDKMLGVARHEVNRFEAHLKDTEAMYKEGVITKNDLLQAEVVLSDARQRFLRTENSRALRASRINSLLLRPLNEDLRAEEVALNHSEGVTLEDAWEVAGAERPELKEVDTKIMAKEEELKAVKAEFYPRAYLSGGYEYQENRYMVHEVNWSIVAGVIINLSSGGATRPRIKRAEAGITALKLTKEKLLDSIRLEVKGVYLELQSARQRVNVTESAVAQAEENLRLQRLRYQEGVGTATDVLDAVALLSKAETNHHKAIYGVKRAEARLLYAMGRDLVKAYGNR